MIYEGPITPGGETYTLSGDAKVRSFLFHKLFCYNRLAFFTNPVFSIQGIYEQILQLNPSYNITDFNIPAPQEAKRAVVCISRLIPPFRLPPRCDGQIIEGERAKFVTHIYKIDSHPLRCHRQLRP